MSYLTDNWFYPSAERIWLCTCLNNAGNYYDITLIIMVMLPNVCNNCVRILEEEKDLVKKSERNWLLIDKPKREKSETVHKPEKVCVKQHQHQFTFVLNN